MERTWRDAKIPKWVSEDMERDLRAHKKTAALSWPAEPKPEPAPFMWGDYDRLTGDPSPGIYWHCDGRGFCRSIEIKANDGSVGATWKKWAFKPSGFGWTTSVPRGKLFFTERDARLQHLWDICEGYAVDLMKARDKL